MASGICDHCGKECSRYCNYCDWNCVVGAAKAAGGTVHCPNGLPIKSVRYDNSMWEHEHGDHPDYKFPVKIDYVGRVDACDYEEYKIRCGEVAVDDDTVRKLRDEIHALIYSDEAVALTMYEGCYTLWSLRDGALLREHLWYKKGEQKLSDASVRMILAGHYEA